MDPSVRIILFAHASIITLNKFNPDHLTAFFSYLPWPKVTDWTCLRKFPSIWNLHLQIFNLGARSIRVRLHDF